MGFRVGVSSDSAKSIFWGQGVLESAAKKIKLLLTRRDMVSSNWILFIKFAGLKLETRGQVDEFAGSL